MTFFTAVILFTLTVQSKDKEHLKFPFHRFLTSSFDTIPATKKNVVTPVNQISVSDSTKQILVPYADTIPLNKIDSLSNKDSSALTQTNDTLLYNVSKNAIVAVVDYSAEDSMVLDVPGKTVTLYGKKAVTNYKDNELTAPVITLDQQTGNIIAAIKRDSAGNVIAFPTYKQGDFTSQSDSIRFNMKSGKGLTKSTYTQQGEMYVYGQVIKKINNDVFYALRGRFTTCDLDTPHFAFISNKIKFINNKVAITGPVHPEFEGVPIPIYLPFGIYPLSQGRHSGFLAPNFATNQQLGLGLEGLGYYKVINDYWDFAVRTSIYSYGGWTLNLSPNYRKRYRYSGRLAFDVQNFKSNFKGDPDYSRNRSYHIAWSHSTDSKARPGVTFSANVNAGSSSYNSYVPDRPVQNFQNQLSSSISYSKTFIDKPYNLTITANHNQNTNLKIINVNLPDVGFNVQTVYPFRKKEFIGTPKWYENIGLAYNGNAKSLFSFYDTLPQIFRQIADTFQFGAHHSIPISLSLPQIGAFQVAPSVSYDETWYQRKLYRTWDTARKKMDTTIQKGFYTARQMSFGLGISTRIFGMITAKNKDAKIQAIRHEIRPTFGVSYKPDFNRNSFYYVQVDTTGRKRQFSVYERNVFSAYSPGRFGGLTFSLDNNLSMKVRNKKDTGENALKKVSLIDGLSLNTSYNFFADSFQLSPIVLSARSNLFDKINITAGAILDPYKVNTQGQRVNELLWQRNAFSLGRLVSGNVSVSSNFRGGDKKTGTATPTPQQRDDLLLNDGYTNNTYDSELAYITNNPGEFADFNIPWSVNFSYSLSFSKIFVLNQGFKSTVSQNTSFGGTLNLTSKWQMGVNGYYNISLGQLNSLALSISRDMHCWQMSINVSPVGVYRFFSINISPKSPLLRDIKVNKTNSFRNL
ncbi:MAG: putative LPS assembly protein LptD [Ginsengibacter sp.]